MILGNEQRRIVAYLDGLQAKVNGLRELTSSVLWTSSPKGEDSAFGVFCFDGLRSTYDN